MKKLLETNEFKVTYRRWFAQVARASAVLLTCTAFGSFEPPPVIYPEGFFNFSFEHAEGIPTEPGLYGWDWLSPPNAFPFCRLLKNDQPWDGYVGHNQWFDYVPNFILFGPSVPEVIDTRYSAGLAAGFDLLGNAYSASLAQIGDVPAGSQSVQVKIAIGSSDFRLFLGGSEISMSPILTTETYTFFGGDISQFAGLKEELRITVEGGHSRIILDDVGFSIEPIPEPGTGVLVIVGLIAAQRMRSNKFRV